jgi:hypothetical protein
LNYFAAQQAKFLHGRHKKQAPGVSLSGLGLVTDTQSQSGQNNFFNQIAGGWGNRSVCGIGVNTYWACSSSFSASAASALTSFNDVYGNILQADAAVVKLQKALRRFFLQQQPANRASNTSVP